MNEIAFLTIAASLVATLFGILIAIVGWMGRRVIERLDSVVEKLGAVARELHEKINHLDLRITTLEARCSYEHDGVSVAALRRRRDD